MMEMYFIGTRTLCLQSAMGASNMALTLATSLSYGILRGCAVTATPESPNKLLVVQLHCG